MRVLLIFFSLLGLADSTFLVWDSLSVTENCGAVLAQFGISTCNSVTESAYGTFLGYPVSVFGVIAYMAIGALTFMGRNDENYRKGIFIITSSGFLMSIFFTFVQWRILEGWCFFCLLSAGFMTVLFLISLAFLGGVSRHIKKRRHDLKISLKVFTLISILTLGIFEAVRGRLLYHSETTGIETSQVKVPGQAIWVGLIGEKFVSLFEINALAGAVEPEYRKHAFDYKVLMEESELSDLTLAEMITRETALRLIPPEPQTPTEETDEAIQDNSSLVAGEEDTLNAELTEEGETAESDPTSTTSTLTELDTYEEREFKAYLGFLERAQQKGKLELWEQYLATLRVKHNVKFTFP